MIFTLTTTLKLKTQLLFTKKLLVFSLETQLWKLQQSNLKCAESFGTVSSDKWPIWLVNTSAQSVINFNVGL